VSLKINNQHTHTPPGTGEYRGRDIILSQKGFNMKKESTELKTLQLGDRNPLLMFFSSLCVFYYCRTYYKAVRVGGGSPIDRGVE